MLQITTRPQTFRLWADIENFLREKTQDFVNLHQILRLGILLNAAVA